MKSLRALALLAATAPLMAGCGAAGGASGNPTVVASFYPLQYVAQRIVGGHATVENLTQPGREPHDLELTVQQTAEVADAGVVFYEKGFQPNVDDAVEQSGPEHVVDTTQWVAPVDGNPHFWLDPVKLSAVAGSFTEEMAKADPANATDYAKNLTALQSDLASLDASYTAGLGKCEIGTTVVSHDAFGALARYGLSFVPINGLSPDAEPSPAHITQLQDLMRSDGITTVFSESLGSPVMADTLASDLGIKSAVLDPIEGLSDATQNEDYLSLMRKNLAALQEANRCS